MGDLQLNLSHLTARLCLKSTYFGYAAGCEPRQALLRQSVTAT